MEYLLVFLEGIVSFISPCLLPMIPIYISYIIATEEKVNKTKEAFINSSGFVIGFWIVFLILSIFASTLGGLVSKYMNILQILFGIIIIIFGLNFMNVIQIDLLNLSNNIKIKHDKKSFFNALLFGMIFSITWTPCIGALLGTALMMIMQEGKIIKGIAMITLYCIGLGIPFIICAVLIDKMKKVFKIIKNNYKIIKNISGIFLIVIGIYTILK